MMRLLFGGVLSWIGGRCCWGSSINNSNLYWKRVGDGYLLVVM